MRAAVEKQLVLIAQGQARYESILEWTLDIFKRKFKYFVENVLAMDMLFEVTFSSLADSGKPMSRLVKLRLFAFNPYTAELILLKSWRPKGSKLS